MSTMKQSEEKWGSKHRDPKIDVHKYTNVCLFLINEHCIHCYPSCVFKDNVYYLKIEAWIKGFILRQYHI